MIVVDASVAVKWIVAEPDSERALALLHGGAPLLAPNLVRVEVANALSRRVRDGRFSPEDAHAAYVQWGTLLDQGAVALEPTDQLIDRAFQIAVDEKHAAADCVYIAAAESVGATVVTADRAMIERGRLVYERIELLARAA
jgi:predicted nucleic acid-binding protein